MCNGIELVNKIDLLLNELYLTRKEFAEQLDLNASTIATWKTKNIIPPVDTLVLISKRLEVSLEWLITQDSYNGISDFQRKVHTRRNIRRKIYDTISKKLGIQNVDNPSIHSSFFSNLPDLTYRILLNWAEGRINLNEFVLQDIAFSLGVSIEYLFSNSQDNTEEQKLEQKLEQNDEYILEAAKRNLNDLFCLDNLTGERKQTGSSILNQLMDLEHRIYVEKNSKDQ